MRQQPGEVQCMGDYGGESRGELSRAGGLPMLVGTAGCASGAETVGEVGPGGCFCAETCGEVVGGEGDLLVGCLRLGRQVQGLRALVLKAKQQRRLHGDRVHGTREPIKSLCYTVCPIALQRIHHHWLINQGDKLHYMWAIEVRQAKIIFINFNIQYDTCLILNFAIKPKCRILSSN